MNPPAHIVLATLNAKYIHASLGLRYLLANMGTLRPQTLLREYTIARPVEEIGAELLSLVENVASPIVGLGVYIWNVVQTTALVRLLKAARPELCVVLGGPEVSHETDDQEICRLADYVITGWGDISFARLCLALQNGTPPTNKVIVGEQASLAQVALPYHEYSDTDLAQRLLYVEASRGCPFKCEFCLSALDKTAWPFELARFLAAMDALYQRGARRFKFVDRTFNLKVDTAVRILQFFMARLPDAEASGSPLFLHFELVPDHLPEQLKALIAQFPPGSLQFEIGIQSFNPAVQAHVSRRQDNAQAEANLRWLLTHSHAHLHTDLLFGLPGETLDSFAASFNRLYALRPHEIQLGILKRLRGTPIVRHARPFGMIYDPAPPYSLRQTSTLDAATLLAFSRFARYWDILANSGRYPRSLALLLERGELDQAVPTTPFHAFRHWSDWLWQRAGRTHGLSPEYLVEALFDYLSRIKNLPLVEVQDALLADYLAGGARAHPPCLKDRLPKWQHTPKADGSLEKRQKQHRNSTPNNGNLIP